MTSDPDFSKSPIRDTLNPSWYSCIFCTLNIEQLWAHMCKYKMPIFMGHPGGILKGPWWWYSCTIYIFDTIFQYLGLPSRSPAKSTL